MNFSLSSLVSYVRRVSYSYLYSLLLPVTNHMFIYSTYPPVSYNLHPLIFWPTLLPTFLFSYFIYFLNYHVIYSLNTSKPSFELICHFFNYIRYSSYVFISYSIRHHNIHFIIFISATIILLFPLFYEMP